MNGDLKFTLSSEDADIWDGRRHEVQVRWGGSDPGLYVDGKCVRQVRPSSQADRGVSLAPTLEGRREAALRICHDIRDNLECLGLVLGEMADLARRD